MPPVERNGAERVALWRVRAVGRCDLGQVERQSLLGQTKVAAEVVRRVGYQPNVGQQAAGGKGGHGGGVEHKVGRKHITRCHPKHIGQVRQGADDATGGF